MSAVLRKIPLCMLLLALVLLAGLGVNPSPAAADPPPCADLVITNFTITSATPPPTEIVEGKNARIDITVLNQGTCKSLSFVVQWKSSPLAPTGPSTYVEGLLPNASKVVTFYYAFPAPGNFNTVATVDTESTVDETNESNNLAIRDVTVLADMADLVITSFTILPTNPVQGVNATINIQVKNQGSKAAGPFVVQWKSDRYAPTGPATQVLSLAAGAISNVSFAYAFPNAGDFTTVATVDTDLSVEEWNEDNNLEIRSVKVLASLPDLVITQMTIVPVDPAPGFPLTPVAGLNARIDIRILNQGNLASGPFVVQWKSDLAAPTGPTDHVSSLNPGASVTVSFQYAFPRPGNFTTAATVDSDNTVFESNESNNLFIEHTVVQEPVIDLVLTEFKVEPAPGVPASTPPLPVQGRLSRATIRMENRGNYPAGDFTVEWKPTLSLPDLSTQVNGLKYGQSTTVTFDYTYPTAGQFQTRATVDSTNRIRETNELNNSQTKLLVVEPQRPDLTITQMQFVPASPVAGTKAKVYITVWNRGNTPANAFVLQWVPAPFTPDLSTQINGLAVGESKTVSFDYTYLFAGSYLSTATADVPNRILELDETNNSKSQIVVVQRATRDLVITGFVIAQGECDARAAAASVVEPVVKQGANVQACIVVQNLGNSAIGPFVVSWNPDAFGLIVPSPATKTHQVDNLDAGQETIVVFDFVYTQAGNFRTVALVDAFNNVWETNESNNLEILNVVVEATGPDLVIAELVVEPGYVPPGSTPPPGRQTCYLQLTADGLIPPGADLEETRLRQGESNRVCIKVRNQGDRRSGPFVVEWNPDAFGLITPSPSTVSTQVSNLEPGAFILIEFNFIYDQAGTYRTIAKADAFNNVRELLEGNNERIRNVVVDPVGPDLVITDLTIGKGNLTCPGTGPSAADVIEPRVRQGEVATVCIKVKNQGDRPSGPFIVEWNPDAFGLITPSPGTLSTQVDNLGISAIQTIKFNFTYHQHGEFRSIAHADAFNNVAESNEANNLKILNVIVDPANIDLQITSFTVGPKQGTEVIRGSKAVASITVKNFGTYPTPAFSVQWRITSEDGSGPFVRVDGLQPNGQAGDSITLHPEGVYYIAGPYVSFAIADVFNEVIETNENNNTKTTPVNVKPRETTVQITFNSIHVHQAFEDGLGCAIDVECHGEWKMIFGVFDPEATCDLGSGDPIKGFQCGFEPPGLNLDTHGGIDDGDTFGANRSFTVVLKESTPVLLAAGGLELDDIFGIPTDGLFTGYALKFWSAADYRGVGSATVASEGGPGSCSNGHCYDVNYTITILSEPPPLATGAQLDAPAEWVMLPSGLVKWLQIPPAAQLPEGVNRLRFQYLPAIDKQK